MKRMLLSLLGVLAFANISPAAPSHPIAKLVVAHVKTVVKSRPVRTVIHQFASNVKERVAELKTKRASVPAAVPKAATTCPGGVCPKID